MLVAHKALVIHHKARQAELKFPARDYAIPKDLSPRLSSILNDFLSDHVRRAWLENSRS